MPKPKLKKGDITINEVLILSRWAFQSKKIDNKAYRARRDVVSAKITGRRNMVYDSSLKRWVQAGREVKFQFIIKTNPKSYKKTDSIKIHKYPVVFVLRDLEKGMNSAFRWRTGSNKKPKFYKESIQDERKKWNKKIDDKKEKVKEAKDKSKKEAIRKEIEKIKDKKDAAVKSMRKSRQKIEDQNIKNGIQMQFFFDLMAVNSKWGLLFGPDTTNKKMPNSANPDYIPFFDKHAWYCVTKILSPLLREKKGFLMNALFKND